MAKKTAKPRRLYIPVVPAGASWIESDSYDRRAWSDIGLGAPAIGELVEAGRRLLPHFDALLGDLFFALFKYNLVWLKTDAVRKSAILNRTILDRLVASPAFEALKSRTLLEEDKAAIAALALAEQALELVRSERLLNRSEMLDLWDLEHQEEDLAQRADELKAMAEAAAPAEGEARIDEELKKKIEKLKEAAARAVKVSEARLNQKARQVTEQIAQANRGELRRMEAEEPRPRAGNRSRCAGQPRLQPGIRPGRPTLGRRAPGARTSSRAQPQARRTGAAGRSLQAGRARA